MCITYHLGRFYDYDDGLDEVVITNPNLWAHLHYKLGRKKWFQLITIFAAKMSTMHITNILPHVYNAECINAVKMEEGRSTNDAGDWWCIGSYFLQLSPQPIVFSLLLFSFAWPGRFLRAKRGKK